jgi:hypothetical protein
MSNTCAIPELVGISKTTFAEGDADAVLEERRMAEFTRAIEGERITLMVDSGEGDGVEVSGLFNSAERDFPLQYSA